MVYQPSPVQDSSGSSKPESEDGKKSEKKKDKKTKKKKKPSKKKKTKKETEEQKKKREQKEEERKEKKEIEKQKREEETKKRKEYNEKVAGAKKVLLAYWFPAQPYQFLSSPYSQVANALTSKIADVRCREGRAESLPIPWPS